MSQLSYRVFLSHGSEDTFVAEAIKEKIANKTSAKVFLDTGEVDFGDDFRKLLIDELSNTDELLVLLTQSSIRRAWVLAEIGASIIIKTRIVAVRYGVPETMLREVGILSLLGTTSSLHIDNLDKYIEQLSNRALAKNE